MSTRLYHLYLECFDHDPLLRVEDESGQHVYALPRIRDEITRRDEREDEILAGSVANRLLHEADTAEDEGHALDCWNLWPSGQCDCGATDG